MGKVEPAQLGRFFEDFDAGTTYQHPFGRTISETDCTWFTLLTCNTNQNHFNAHLAASNPITGGRVIVNSGLTVPLVLGLSVIEMRESSSRPEMGIIRMQTRGLNQDGDEVVSWFRSVMIPKRTSGIGQNYFPAAKAGPMEPTSATVAPGAAPADPGA